MCKITQTAGVSKNMTFFVPLGRGALLTPHCWQFLASLLRPLAKDPSLFLDPLSGTHYHCPSEKHSVLQHLKRNLRLIFFTSICAEVQVLVSVCTTQEVFVCACVYVCVCVCVRACVRVCLSSVCIVGVIFVYVDTVDTLTWKGTLEICSLLLLLLFNMLYADRVNQPCILFLPFIEQATTVFTCQHTCNPRVFSRNSGMNIFWLLGRFQTLDHQLSD